MRISISVRTWLVVACFLVISATTQEAQGLPGSETVVPELSKPRHQKRTQPAEKPQRVALAKPEVRHRKRR